MTTGIRKLPFSLEPKVNNKQMVVYNPNRNYPKRIKPYLFQGLLRDVKIVVLTSCIGFSVQFTKEYPNIALVAAISCLFVHEVLKNKNREKTCQQSNL